MYKWTNLTNGRWYVGSHSGTVDDGYIGSGKVFKSAIKKYGIHNFKRDILYVGEDFIDQENYYLKLWNAAEDINSYNIASKAIGGLGFIKGCIPWNKGKRYSKRKGQIPWNLGKSFSKEAIHKMRLAKLGKPSPNKGKKLGPEAANKAWKTKKNKHD